MLTQADAADQPSVPDGLSLPDEFKRREDRLAAIAEAKAKIEVRAEERFEHERAEYEAKMAARAAKAAESGKKPGGLESKAPDPTPRIENQVNLTDEASRIMKVAGGGFAQCFNAQAVVDTESMLAMFAQVTDAANDKTEVALMIEKVLAFPRDCISHRPC